MKRRAFLMTSIAALVLTGQAACAQTSQDQVIAQLKSQGYSHIRVRRTLLGRVRILASGSMGRREIVLNPSTGIILRDYLYTGTQNASDSSSSDRASDSKDASDSSDTSDDDNGDDGSDDSGDDGSDDSGDDGSDDSNDDHSSDDGSDDNESSDGESHDDGGGHDKGDDD
ncbi:hypothetical protein [Primorskyibacter sp. 2E233]|uniref:hypothetical protein n=1 Tax=Primorskyibacter sp. 2E233 TaxID=3413431 RepID=UPI003BF2D2B6